MKMHVPSLETIEIESLELEEVEEDIDDDADRGRSKSLPSPPTFRPGSCSAASCLNGQTQRSRSKPQRHSEGWADAGSLSKKTDRRGTQTPSVSFSHNDSLALDIAHFKKHRNQCTDQDQQDLQGRHHSDTCREEAGSSNNSTLSTNDRTPNHHPPASAPALNPKKKRWKLLETASLMFAFLSQRKKASTRDKVSVHPDFPPEPTRRHGTGTTHTTTTTVDDHHYRHSSSTGKTFTRSSSYCSEACKDDEGSFVLSTTSSSSSILLFDSRTFFSSSMVHAQSMGLDTSSLSSHSPADGNICPSSSSSSSSSTAPTTGQFSDDREAPEEDGRGTHLRQSKHSSRHSTDEGDGEDDHKLSVCIEGTEAEDGCSGSSSCGSGSNRSSRSTSHKRHDTRHAPDDSCARQPGFAPACRALENSSSHASPGGDPTTAPGAASSCTLCGGAETRDKKKGPGRLQTTKNLFRKPSKLFSSEQQRQEDRKDDEFDFYYGSRTRRRRTQFGWKLSNIFDSLRTRPAQAFSDEDERLYVEEILHFSRLQSIPVSLSILIIYTFYAVPRMMCVWHQIFYSSHPSLLDFFLRSTTPVNSLNTSSGYSRSEYNPHHPSGFPPDPASHTASLISFVFWSISCLFVVIFVGISVFGTKMKTYEKAVCITTTFHFMAIAFAECFQVLRLSFLYSSLYERASAPTSPTSPPQGGQSRSSSASWLTSGLQGSTAPFDDQVSQTRPAASSPSSRYLDDIGEEWSGLIPDNVVLQFVFLIAIDFIYCIRVHFSQWVHVACLGITLLLCVVLTIAITTLPTYRLASLWSQAAIAFFVLICFHLASIALESERRRNFLHFELARKRVAELQRKIIGATEGKVAVVRLITALKNMGTHLCHLHEDVSPDVAETIEQLEALRLECLGIVTSSDNLYAARTDLLPAEVLQMLQLHSRNGFFHSELSDQTSSGIQPGGEERRVTRFSVDREIIAPSFKELSHDLFESSPSEASRRPSETAPRAAVPKSLPVAKGPVAGGGGGRGACISVTASPQLGPVPSSVSVPPSLPASPRESTAIVSAGPACFSVEARKTRLSWSSANHPRPTPPRPPLVEGVELLSHVGSFWPIDMLKLNAQCEGNALLHVGSQLLDPFLASGHLQCERETLHEFLYSLQKLYKDNPYHSQVHGAMVAHLSLTAANLLELFRQKPLDEGGEPHPARSISIPPPPPASSSGSPTSPPNLTSSTNQTNPRVPHSPKTSSTEPRNSGVTSLIPNHQLSLIIASLGHDVGHPGRSNNFLINTSSNLSVVYNDKSVLENYHACLTFYTLSHRACSILREKSVSEYRSIRKQIIELILSTDMSQHFETITRVAARRESPDFDFHEKEDDRLLIMSVCIKTADIGHCALDWDQHETWSKRVVEEFFSQGDEEKRLGLPVSPLCDRLQQEQLPKNQANFIDFLFLPLAGHLGAIAPDERFSHTVITRAKQNALTWKRKQAESSAAPTNKKPAVGGSAGGGGGGGGGTTNGGGEGGGGRGWERQGGGEDAVRDEQMRPSSCSSSSDLVWKKRKMRSAS